MDDLIRDYHGIKYLTLFFPKKYYAIFDKIRYLTSLKSAMEYVDSHNYAKIKIDSDDDLSLEKALTMHTVVKLNESIFNKNYN